MVSEGKFVRLMGNGSFVGWRPFSLLANDAQSVIADPTLNLSLIDWMNKELILSMIVDLSCALSKHLLQSNRSWNMPELFINRIKLKVRSRA